MKVITTITFCCDNPWKVKSMAVEKPDDDALYKSTVYLLAHLRTAEAVLKVWVDGQSWRPGTYCHFLGQFCLEGTHSGQLILRITSKIGATECQILRHAPNSISAVALSPRLR